MKYAPVTRRMLTGFLFVILPYAGLSYTYTWTGSGANSNWSNSANWSPLDGGSSYPGTNDYAIFDGTSSSDCFFDVPIVLSLHLTNAYSGNVKQGNNVVSINNFTVDGGSFIGSSYDINITGTLSFSGGNFKSTSGKLNLYGDFTMSGGSFDANGGTVVLLGNNKSISAPASMNFFNVSIATSITGYKFNSSFGISNDLTLNAGSADLALTISNGATVSVAGNVHYTSTGTSSIIINTGTLQLTGTGKMLDLPSGGSTTNGGGGTGTIQFTGTNQTIDGTSFDQTWMLPNVSISQATNLKIVNEITVAGNLSLAASTISAGTSTVILCPSTTVTISSDVPWSLYNLKVIGRGATSDVQFNGTAPSVSYLLSLGNTDGSQTNYTSVTINSSPLYANALLTQGSSTAGNNSLKILKGIIEITGYNALLGYSLNIGSGSTYYYSATDVLGTIRFSGALNTNQIITRSSAAGSLIGPVGLLPNVEINCDGGLNLGPNTISLSGNWTYKKGTVDCSTSLVNFYNLNTSQTVTAASLNGNMSFYGMGFNSKNLVLGSDITLLGSLSGASTGSILDPSLSNFSITLSGDWNLAGDIYNSRFATVIFTGTNPQTISKLHVNKIDSYPFYNLTVSKNSNNITLNSPVIVSKHLVLTKGNIVTDSNNILVLNYNYSDVTPAIGSASSFVDGPLQWSINSSGAATCPFPIGSGTDWSPLSLYISMTSANSANYVAQMIKTSPITAFGYSLNILPRPMNRISNVRYWKVYQDNTNSSGVAVTAYFNDLDQVMDSDPTHLSLARSSISVGSKWADTGTSTGTTYSTPITPPYRGYVTTQTLAKISNSTSSNADIFTFGDVYQGNNPLPITVSSFKATYDKIMKAVVTDWETESQEHGAYFTLERADKSLAFESLTTVTPEDKNSSSHQEYTYVDLSPLGGLSYYRLKQTDVKGQITYHGVVSVAIEQDGTADFYPNPGNGQSLKFAATNLPPGESNLRITVRNVLGEIITHSALPLDQNNRPELLFNPPLENGIYYIHFELGEKQYSFPYLVKN